MHGKQRLICNCFMKLSKLSNCVLLLQGEHGVGLGKKDSLRKEVGDVPIGVMRAIKSSLDPRWLMNPGKIFDRT
jgi:hypothetical protein